MRLPAILYKKKLILLKMLSGSLPNIKGAIEKTTIRKKRIRDDCIKSPRMRPIFDLFSGLESPPPTIKVYPR
jgi:hypothetical protein